MRTIEEIQQEVCKEFHIGMSDLLGGAKESTVSIPRHISAIICLIEGYAPVEVMSAHKRHKNGFVNTVKSFSKVVIENEYYREGMKRVLNNKGACAPILRK